MLCIIVVTLGAGAVVYSRISGDYGDIRLNPDLLTEPIQVISRAIGNTDPVSGSDNPPETGGSSDISSQEGAPREEAAAAPTPEPTEPPTRTLSLTAVGQIHVGEELRADAQSAGSSAISFDPVFEPLSGILSGADLSIATLRTGVTEDSSAYDAYNAPTALVSALQGAGVNMFNLSTDRLLDHGAAGVSATLSAMRQLGAASIGAYADETERNALFLQNINGVQVGLLAYTATLSNVGRGAASEAEIAIATRMLDTQAATADVRALKEAGADIVIVLAHWSGRNETRATREVQEIATALIEAGADIILGTNPTSIHDMEMRTVTDADGNEREAFIAYSLGNFLIDDSRETTAITGLVLHLNLQWDTQAKRLSFPDAWYMPTWIMRYRDDAGIQRYRLVAAGAESRPENMIDTIYINMLKSYQSTVNNLGDMIARPRQEP